MSWRDISLAWPRYQTRDGATILWGVAFTRGLRLSESSSFALRRNNPFGFWSLLRDDGTEDEDLVDVGEDDDTAGWVPFREVLYRWRRGEQGRVAYYLWFVRAVVWGDPDDCNPHDFDNGEYDFESPIPIQEVTMSRSSSESLQ
jgi:hypothetical protein